MTFDGPPSSPGGSDQAAFTKHHRILVTGANGMLGKAILDQVARHAPGWGVLALNHGDWDVTDPSKIEKLAEEARGGWIIHCAGLVNVEECARNPDLARKAIVDGTLNAIRLAELAEAKFLYPQSFLIYDGLENPITENTNPSPLSLYGMLKLEAEQHVKSRLKEHLIVRMAGFFGGEAKDKNFVGKIIPHLANLIKTGQRSFGVGDRIWQPTFTNDLALNSILLIAHAKSGTYQMACLGSASFYDLTSKIVDILGWQNKMRLERLSSRNLAQKELGKRPDRAIMANNRLVEEGLERQRPWEVALGEYLASPYFDRFRF